jgi:hypothetical protein
MPSMKAAIPHSTAGGGGWGGGGVGGWEWGWGGESESGLSQLELRFINSNLP